MFWVVQDPILHILKETFLTRFTSVPTDEHYNAAMQVLRDLAKLPENGLVIRKVHNRLIGYCDAEYAVDLIGANLRWDMSSPSTCVAAA